MSYLFGILRTRATCGRIFSRQHVELFVNMLTFSSTCSTFHLHVQLFINMFNFSSTCSTFHQHVQLFINMLNFSSTCRGLHLNLYRLGSKMISFGWSLMFLIFLKGAYSKVRRRPSSICIYKYIWCKQMI